MSMDVIELEMQTGVPNASVYLSGNMQLKWGKRGKSNLFSHRILEFGKR